MFIEWAVNCYAIEADQFGYSLIGAGQTGFDATDEPGAFDTPIRLLGSFRFEPGDESGGDYDFWTQVHGPDGPQPALTHPLTFPAESAATIHRNRRLYLDLEIVIAVLTGGPYTIVFGDDVSERYRLDLFFASLPRP
jgi:hypothetical protein